MSSIEELEALQAGLYVGVAFFALYFFDSIATFPQEVKVIWCRKWTVTTWLYAFTRYTTLIFSIQSFIPIPIKICVSSQHFVEALELIQLLCFAVFAALRVYALLNAKATVPAVVFLLNMVPFVMNLYVFVGATAVVADNSCRSYFTLPANVVLNLTLATRITVIAADVLVTAVTWFKTARLYRDARRLNLKAPLASMLLHDGTIYFILLLLFNIFQIIEQQSPILYLLGISTSLQEVMTPIIICRFILDLRQVNASATDPSAIFVHHSTNIRFVGNMGQSLQTGAEMEDEEETSSHSYEMEESSTHAGTGNSNEARNISLHA